MKILLIYIRQCAAACFKSSWGLANGIFGAVVAATVTEIYGPIKIFSNTTTQTPNHTMTLVIWSLAAWIIILLFEIIFFAPFILWKSSKDRISQLQKIDNDDLEYLLHGKFIGNTFMFKSEITPCKFYKGRNEIERLRNTFTEIPVPAPKHSWASLDIRLYNGRSNTSQPRFYILNEDSKPTLIENIYEELSVFLNEKSRFSFKVEWDNDYIIHEQAELRISANSWTK